MPKQKLQPPAQTTAKSHTSDKPLPTFLDHVHELRRRLFWIIGIVLVTSSVAYSFLGGIIDVLTHPLGNERLVYLTPGGGLSFSIKLCAYVGILVAVPLIMYHLYRFLEPLMGKWRKSAVFYLGFSSFLAASGVLFAYFVSLPAALNFLTGFNVQHIEAMLTGDAYLSFVITYLLGAALLFQIPLLLLIINTMTPLKPSKLMKLQRFVIVGAFILGAIISPTPDIMNQAFLAVPIIAMYQLGVGLVWLQNRARARRGAVVVAQPQASDIPDDILLELAKPVVAQPAKIMAQQVTPGQIVAQQSVARAVRRPSVMSDFTVANPVRQGAVSSAKRSVLHAARPAPSIKVPTRSVDGFTTYRSPVVTS